MFGKQMPSPRATYPYHLSPRRRTIAVDAPSGRSRTLTTAGRRPPCHPPLDNLSASGGARRPASDQSEDPCSPLRRRIPQIQNRRSNVQPPIHERRTINKSGTKPPTREYATPPETKNTLPINQTPYLAPPPPSIPRYGKPLDRSYP